MRCPWGCDSARRRSPASRAWWPGSTAKSSTRGRSGGTGHPSIHLRDSAPPAGCPGCPPGDSLGTLGGVQPVRRHAAIYALGGSLRPQQGPPACLQARATSSSPCRRAAAGKTVRRTVDAARAPVDRSDVESAAWITAIGASSRATRATRMQRAGDGSFMETGSIGGGYLVGGSRECTDRPNPSDRHSPTLSPDQLCYWAWPVWVARHRRRPTNMPE